MIPITTFVFTYGADHWSQGGWTEITTETEEDAQSVFRGLHGSLSNCSSVYPEEEFLKTKMFRDGNLGKRCVESIYFHRQVDPAVAGLADLERKRLHDN